MLSDRHTYPHPSIYFFSLNKHLITHKNPSLVENERADVWAHPSLRSVKFPLDVNFRENCLTRINSILAWLNSSEWRISESEVAQLCLTLCNPMDCSLPGSSIQGIFQARVLEWVPFPSAEWRIRKLFNSSAVCLKVFLLIGYIEFKVLIESKSQQFGEGLISFCCS